MNLFSSRRVKPLRKVGIVLAAYQPSQQLFEGQLESIRAQDHPDWFCIVTMDSPMLAVEEAPWIRRFYEDNRFHFYQNDSQLGVLKNFERGSHIALNLGAEAISFSDQDDFWHPNKVSRSLQMLNQQPPLSAVCCDARVKVNGVLQQSLRSEYASKTARRSYTATRIFFTSGLWGNGMTFDAALVQLHSYIASEHTNHDGHISFIAAVYGRAAFFPEPLLDYNIHDTNVVGIRELSDNQNESIRIKHKKNNHIKRWASTRKMLRNTTSRQNPFRIFISTYVGMMALLSALLLEEKFLYGNKNRRILKHFKGGASLLARWRIPQMWINSLLFSRRRSALRRRS
jgi:hypothetical protein